MSYLLQCFNCLPVVAIIDHKIFCCHGGLSPALHSLEQIRLIQRPTDVPDSGEQMKLYTPISNSGRIFVQFSPQDSKRHLIFSFTWARSSLWSPMVRSEQEYRELERERRWHFHGFRCQCSEGSKLSSIFSFSLLHYLYCFQFLSRHNMDLICRGRQVGNSLLHATNIEHPLKDRRRWLRIFRWSWTRHNFFSSRLLWWIWKFRGNHVSRSNFAVLL